MLVGEDPGGGAKACPHAVLVEAEPEVRAGVGRAMLPAELGQRGLGRERRAVELRVPEADSCKTFAGRVRGLSVTRYGASGRPCSRVIE